MRIVNIRGATASGKSSIPMSMLDDPKMEIIWKPYKGRQKKILTLFPSYGWMALGAYLIKTGGMDGFDDKILTAKAFWYALKHYPQYNLIMEGCICSTIFSTYADLFKEAQDKYPDADIQVVTLMPPIEECYKRVYARNGNKPIKKVRMEEKYKNSKRSHEKFVEAGFNAWAWDNTVITDEKLIHQLERKMDEHRKEYIRKKGKITYVNYP